MTPARGGWTGQAARVLGGCRGQRFAQSPSRFCKAGPLLPTAASLLVLVSDSLKISHPRTLMSGHLAISFT